MTAKNYQVSLKLRAPVMTRSTTGGRLGVDAVFNRSSDGKSLEIPKELITGRVREALTYFSDVAPTVVPKALVEKSVWTGCASGTNRMVSCTGAG